MIELIVSDLDDTLLNPAGDLSPRTLAALHAAIEAGAYVTFASGRMLEAASFFAAELGINAPLIVYNGALVYDLSTERTLSRLDIPMQTAQAICRLGEEMGVYMQAYPGSNYFCANNCKYTDAYGASVRVKALETPDHQPLSEWISSDQVKLLAIGEREDMPAALARFREAFPTGVDFFMSRPMYLEIVSNQANKANALRALAGSLGIKPENIMAFGDGENDIEMLEYAGHSYAVSNAGEAVRARAKGIAPSNAEDGVAQIIEKWLAEGKIGRG